MATVRSTVTYVKNEVEKRIKLAGNINKWQNIKPAWKWGQNKTHIILHVKFNYKFDLPGCSDIFNPSLVIKDSGVEFSANGIQNSIPIKYNLAFKLNQPSLSHGTYFKLGRPGAGSILLFIKKGSDGIWKFLTSEDDKVDESKVWWDFKKDYPEEMKEYMKMIGKEEEQQAFDPKTQTNEGMRSQFTDTLTKMKADQEKKKADPNYKKKEKTGKPEDDFDFDDMDFDKMMGEMQGMDFSSMFKEGAPGMQKMEAAG